MYYTYITVGHVMESVLKRNSWAGPGSLQGRNDPLMTTQKDSTAFPQVQN